MYLPLTVGNVIALGFVSLQYSTSLLSKTRSLYSTLPSSSPTMNARCDSMRPIQSRLRKGSSWLLGPRRCSRSHSFGSGGSHFETPQLSKGHTLLCHLRWTSFPHISFWAPMMSGLLMGISTLALIVSDAPLSLTETHCRTGISSQLHHR